MVSGETLSRKVYLRLKEKIISLEFPPGMILQEAMLATIFEVSRTPVREAMNLLLQEGWLDRRARILMVRQPTEIDIQQIFEIRSILEIASLKKAFLEGNPRLLAGLLDDLVVSMVKESDFRKFMGFDIEFHALIVKQMNNPKLTQFWYNIYEETFRGGLWSMSTVANRKNDVIDEHRVIAESCWERDFEKTLKALSIHHNNSKDALLQGLNLNNFEI